MAFFIYQLAQTETSISFPKPFIRCIGFEETLDEARLLARASFDEKKMETRIMPTGKVFLAGKKKYVGLDLPRREEEQLKANSMIDEWILKRENIIADVARSAKEKIILPDPVFKEKTEEFLEPDDTIEIYKRGFFALAIIPGDEPALLALAFHEKLEHLQEKMKELAANPDYKHLDIYAGETGKWMPLSNPSSLKTQHHDAFRQSVETLLN